MQLKKSIKLGKNKIYNFFYLIILFSLLTLDINKETKFENLIIKVLKCKNSEFDDNPEITAYMQVQDTTLDNNDQVFVFNGWTFSSSPSITLFDHPVYDIWLSKCY